MFPNLCFHVVRCLQHTHTMIVAQSGSGRHGDVRVASGRQCKIADTTSEAEALTRGIPQKRIVGNGSGWGSAFLCEIDIGSRVAAKAMCDYVFHRVFIYTFARRALGAEDCSLSNADDACQAISYPTCVRRLG